MSESNLAERFARTQGETKCRFHGGYIPKGGAIANYDSPMCTCRIPAIDVSILPIIWADCRAKGWGCKTEYTPWLEPAGHSATVFVDPGWKEYEVFSDDPVAALCEAYCKAVECIETGEATG